MYCRYKICSGTTGPTGPKGSSGNPGLNGLSIIGPTGPTGSVPDVSFSLDKNGSQLIPASVNSFTYTTITAWSALGYGQYNTGSLNDVSGVFTAPLQGKYQFIGSVQAVDLPAPDSIICLRLRHIQLNLQLAETRIIANPIFNPNSGICISIVHQLVLDVGDMVDLQMCYLTTTPTSGMPIGSNLGITRFVGYLLRQTIGDTP